MSTFFISHFWLIVGSLAGLSGVLGIAALVFLGIPAAQVIVELLAIFKRLLAFFTTPIGQVIGVVILCAVCLFLGDLHGQRTQIAQCNKRVAALDAVWAAKVKKAGEEFAAARKNRDSNVEDYVNGLVASRTAELAAKAADLQKKVDEYEKTDSHHGLCVLGPADIDGGVRH